MPVDSIGTIGTERIFNQDSPGLPIPKERAEEGKTFGQFLTDAIGDVNSLQQNAGDLVKRYASGERMDVHNVMIALEKASTSMALTMQVRNKLVDAYQEIIKTPM